MKFNGTVFRRGHSDGSQSPNGDTDELDSAAVTQRYTVPSKLKWKAVFEKIEVLLLGENVPNAKEKKCAWENLSVQFHQSKIGFQEGRGEGKERKKCKSNWKGFDLLETIPKVAKVIFFRKIFIEILTYQFKSCKLVLNCFLLFKKN